ncbi:hypothetical protein PENSPDRAFT_405634 [Peniophora sp. CONT]|nr:hypothetical protein PENSPDRAFT_405634 [Peniophora sp. CONT]
MFVFISRVETGERLWNPVVNRSLFSLMIMHALMALTIELLMDGRTMLGSRLHIPPFIMVILFKMYINKVFHHRFRYYTPTEDELRAAKIHSERADIKGNRLEKRFGHPALYAELFTPMLHANMMLLLAEVYRGKIARPRKSKLGEYGGKELNAQVMPGGLRVVAVSQGDLEYDPALFRRDRGELDWDQRIIATTVLCKGGDNASLYTTKQPFGRAQYLAHVPGASEIELSRFDNDQVPFLLPALGYIQSSASLPDYPPSRMGTPTLCFDLDELAPPPAPYHGVHQAYASQSSVDLSGGYQQYPSGVYQPLYEREAPMYRSQGTSSPQRSYNSQRPRAYSPTPPPQEPSDGNMVGRGARNMYRA